MPLDRFVLLVVAVIGAAGVTIVFALWIEATLAYPRIGIALMLPLAVLAYIIVRVIAERMRERDDEAGRYDGERPK